MSDGMPEFDERQWETLKCGPLYMQGLVAGADAHIDATEWHTFIESVIAAAAEGDELTRTVMAALLEQLDAGADVPPRNPLEGLKEVRFILESREDRGLALRETLLEIGATVAEASGAQLTRTFASHRGEPGWARSAGTSAVERAAIVSAAEALNLSVTADS